MIYPTAADLFRAVEQEAAVFNDPAEFDLDVDEHLEEDDRVIEDLAYFGDANDEGRQIRQQQFDDLITRVEEDAKGTVTKGTRDGYRGYITTTYDTMLV